jgi:hypothetical protein
MDAYQLLSGNVIGADAGVREGMAVGAGDGTGMIGVGEGIFCDVAGTRWSACTKADTQLNSVKRTMHTHSASSDFLLFIMSPKRAAHEDLIYAAHFIWHFTLIS